MTVPDKCDVVVIGGGPAGSLAATYLTQAGYHTVLLEKQKHPRNTVGESLIPDFWKYCDQAKVADKVAAENFIRKAGGTVDWHGARQRISFKDFGYTRPALHVERDRFDDILLQHARAEGTEVNEEVTVLGVDLGAAHGVRVTYRPRGDVGSAQVSCRYVVDASGQDSVISRQLGLRVIDRDFRFMSVWGYFRNAKYLAADGLAYEAAFCRSNPPTTYVSSVPGTGDWGWCWHIMLRDRTSVGLVLPIEAARDVKGGLDAWENYLVRQCRAMPQLRALMEDAPLYPGSVRVIRDYSYRTAGLAGPGYFLIGDAAGFVDPIFSVGVVLGMFSAWASAWAIDRILRLPGGADRYQSMYASHLRCRLELSRALALPKYDIGDAATRSAKQAMQLADPGVRALMLAASNLTARSKHFHALVEDTAGSGDLPR